MINFRNLESALGSACHYIFAAQCSFKPLHMGSCKTLNDP